jgi:adenylate cyclase
MAQNTPLVLIVDDNEMNRDMLARRLERLEYHTITAEDGIKAMALLRQEAIDLILLDVMMPNMNGYEVLEQVKQDPLLGQIPIIMISAVDDLDSVVRCIELGAEDYLFKPFNPVLLKARVGASLDKRRLQKRGSSLLMQPVLEGISNDIEALIASGLSPDQQLIAQGIQDRVRDALEGL